MTKKRYKLKNEPLIFNDKGSFSKGVPEIQISFEPSEKRFSGSIENAADVAKFFRSLFKKGEISRQEQVLILYLNSNSEIIGFNRHSIGGIDFSTADTRLIVAAALKSLAKAIIICHNHPSGSLTPSEEDIKNTKKLIKAASAQNIQVLDHIILTNKGFSSLMEKGYIKGLSGYPTDLPDETKKIRPMGKKDSAPDIYKSVAILSPGNSANKIFRGINGIKNTISSAMTSKLRIAKIKAKALKLKFKQKNELKGLPIIASYIIGSAAATVTAEAIKKVASRKRSKKKKTNI